MPHVIAQTLSALQIPTFPCHSNKKPATPNGHHDATVQLGTYWPSDVIGLPIIPGVVVLDVDAYKGMTTQKIDQALGCNLDWDAAFLQSTPRGGYHYAFASTAPLLTTSDWFSDLIGEGFDTRTTGDGYICTGEGYSWENMIKLSEPAALPALPPRAAMALIKTIAPPLVNEVELPTGERDNEEIARMLEHLDPDCSYDEWFRIACGLKHYYHDDVQAGFDIFDQWSSTAEHTGKYDQHESLIKWNSVQPTARSGQRPITLGSVVDMAKKSGNYVPTKAMTGMTAADAFGGGPAETPVIPPSPPITMPDTIAFNEMPDTWVLANATSESGANAVTMLADYYQGRLYSRGKFFMWWSGDRYQGIEKIAVKRSVSNALIGTLQHKLNVVNGTTDMLEIRSERLQETNPANKRVYFTNGWIDFGDPDGVLMQHHPSNLNTYTLPFPYTPTPPPVQFIAFLNDVFSNDEDKSDKILAIQEILGWALIGDTLGIQKAVVLRGVTRGGKGTILKILTKILHDSFTPLSGLTSLIDDKTLSSMRDTNITIEYDAKSVPHKDTNAVIGMINKMTANEPIDIKLLHTQEPWMGSLNTKLYMACNRLPSMIDDSGAIIGRLHQITFNKSSLGCEDTHLDDKLGTELDSIGMWAIEGLKRLVVNRRFTVPASSIAAQDDANESSQPMMLFINECTVMGDDHKEYRVHSKPLYQRWCKWSEENGTKPGSRPNFVAAVHETLRSKGVVTAKQLKIDGLNTSGFRGIKLLPAIIPSPIIVT